MQSKPLCSSWNGGRAILGIQDASGTRATAIPGYNSTQWTATNEAWRIRPTGALEYDVQWFKRTTKGPHAGELQQITSEVSGLPSGLRAIVAEPTI